MLIGDSIKSRRNRWPVSSWHRWAAIGGLVVLAACSGDDEGGGGDAADAAVSDAGVVLAGVAGEGADLMVCNLTTSSVGVAVGYPDGGELVTEGWWNLSPRDTPNDCAAVVSGELKSQYYYVYAVDYTLGGEWAGDIFMCTSDREFTIRGVEDCVARGYDRLGFVEIDTGDRTVHIVQLTDQQGVSSR